MVQNRDDAAADKDFDAYEHEDDSQRGVQKRLLRFLIETTSDFILEHDLEGRFIALSPAACTALGYSTGEVPALTIQEIDGDAYLDNLREAFAGARQEAPHPVEATFCKKDGTKFFVRGLARLIRKGEDSIIVSALRPVDRRAGQDQVTQAQKLEAIGQLASGIAHEINTPTQYVGDNTRFLKDAYADFVAIQEQFLALFEAAKAGPVGKDQLEALESTLVNADLPYLIEEIPKAISQSLEGVEQIARIVRAMKEFSHPGADEKTLIDINHAIENTITVARNEWKYVADIVRDLDPSLPMVACLPGSFNQVLLNILVNAAHAIGDVVEDSGKKGTITIATRVEGESVAIAISDTGTGIPDHVLPRIFDPFFTTKEVGKGTGQGLALAYSIVVEKHGGTISIDTAGGKGTTITVRIPARTSIQELAA
jgi:PAS domain S-box-containing protein